MSGNAIAGATEAICAVPRGSFWCSTSVETPMPEFPRPSSTHHEGYSTSLQLSVFEFSSSKYLLGTAAAFVPAGACLGAR